jgi:uncharacterized protein (TIGR02996 family)
VLALLTAVKDDPDNDTPRLVLADWLEEQGDKADRERSELIRLQCQQAQLKTYEGEYFELRSRIDRLLKAHGAKWRGRLAARGHIWKYSRGLLHLECNGQCLVGAGTGTDRWEETAWLEHLTLSLPPGNDLLQTLLSSAVLDGLVSLELAKTGLQLATTVALAQSPHLNRLTSLLLYECGIGVEGGRALAGSSHLHRLRQLNLGGNRLGDEGVIALAGSPLLEKVETLSLWKNAITDRGIEAFLRTPRPSLTTLWLNRNGISDAGARLLADRSTLPDLSELLLTDNPLTDKGRSMLRERFGNGVQC